MQPCIAKKRRAKWNLATDFLELVVQRQYSRGFAVIYDNALTFANLMLW